MHCGDCRFNLVDKSAFRYFQLQVIRRHAGFVQDFLDDSNKVFLMELSGRKIYGHSQSRNRCSLTASFIQYPFSEWYDQARLFCKRDETVRWDQSLARMPPAQESLETQNLTRSDIDLGLI